MHNEPKKGGEFSLFICSFIFSLENSRSERYLSIWHTCLTENTRSHATRWFSKMMMEFNTYKTEALVRNGRKFNPNSIHWRLTQLIKVNALEKKIHFCLVRKS